MLYVTTQNDIDPVTAPRVLKESRGFAGGLYVPLRNPKLTAEDLDILLGKSFSDRIAEILNLLFHTKLTGWDIDFCIGRRPVRLVSLRNRILIGECWHNPDWHISGMIRSIMRLLQSETDLTDSWPAIAARISVLFGIFGELKANGIERTDIAIASGDLSMAVSAWYSREWGLPIENIIICCNENNQLWELVCHGQLRTDAISIPTITPEADLVLPVNLERMIHACGGTREVLRYLDLRQQGKAYRLDDQVLSKLQHGQYVSVVSSHRLRNTIRGAYGTHRYILEPLTALVYAGLQDYRAKSGTSRHALLISEKSPLCSTELIADALGIPTEELKEHL